MANELGIAIADEVKRAEMDYQNVRTRALNVVGLSAGLVALLSGAIAIAAGTNKVDFAPLAARITLLLALLAYVLATIIALVINLPGTVNYLTADELEGYAKDHWNDTGWDQNTAIYLTSYLRSLRINNSKTAKFLTKAIGVEIAGIALTAATALVVVWSLPTSSAVRGSATINQAPPPSLNTFYTGLPESSGESTYDLFTGTCATFVAVYRFDYMGATGPPQETKVGAGVVVNTGSPSAVLPPLPGRVPFPESDQAGVLRNDHEALIGYHCA